MKAALQRLGIDSPGRRKPFHLRRTFSCWLAAALLAGANAPAAGRPIRVLILSGQNNHDWQKTTPKLKSILSAGDRCAVDVTNHPEQLGAPELQKFDVVLSDWNAWDNAAVKNWPESTRAAFLDFVRGGKGLVVVHAGSSSFYDWPDYQRLAGASWKLGQTTHGAPHEFTVQPAGGHPVTRGVAPFRTTDELWLQPGVDPGAQVIAQGDSQPVAVATTFGQGRGFTLLLGHSPDAMNAPGFQTLLLRGVEWAATGKVTLPPNAGDEAALETILQSLASYRFGDSRGPALALEQRVGATSGNSAERKALARRLATALATRGTTDGKRIVCWHLSRIATPAEVPVLAGLLADKDLAYYARSALERLPGKEAENALLSALKKAAGQDRVGLINSIGAHRSRSAVPTLAPLMEDSDPIVAGAAIDALGCIRGPEAVQALTQAKGKVADTLNPRLAESLFRCASGLIATGNPQPALPILGPLTSTNHLPSIRRAAFAAKACALGRQGGDVLVMALAGPDAALAAGAVDALRSTPDASLAGKVAAILDQLSPSLQVQVIAWLGEERDTSTIPALKKALASGSPLVREEAILALGMAGNASAIPILAQTGAAGTDADRALVTKALAHLRGERIDEHICAALDTASTAEQSLLIRGLVARRATVTVPVLLRLAAGKDHALGVEAIAATGKLGTRSTCDPLAAFLVSEPEAAAQAMAEICWREGTTEPLLTALADAPVTGKIAVLGTLDSMGGPEALAAVRTALKSDDSQLRTAAVRSLANWQDAAPLEDLAVLAADRADPRIQTLALRGVARLAPLAKDRSPEKTVEIVTSAMKAGGGLTEQKALLAALGEIPGEASAKAVEALVNDSTLGAEAKAALEQIKARRANAPPPQWDEAALQWFQSPANLCHGATATNLDGLAPDGQGEGPHAAVDANPVSYWDETDNQKLYWLRVKLKARSTVSTLRILGWRHHDYAPKDFEILCDGKAVKKVENAQYSNNLLTVALPPTECGEVDLKITGYYGQSPAIRELGLFAQPDAR